MHALNVHLHSAAEVGHSDDSWSLLPETIVTSLLLVCTCCLGVDVTHGWDTNSHKAFVAIETNLQVTFYPLLLDECVSQLSVIRIINALFAGQFVSLSHGSSPPCIIVAQKMTQWKKYRILQRQVVLSTASWIAWIGKEFGKHQKKASKWLTKEVKRHNGNVNFHFQEIFSVTSCSNRFRDGSRWIQNHLNHLRISLHCFLSVIKWHFNWQLQLPEIRPQMTHLMFGFRFETTVSKLFPSDFNNFDRKPSQKPLREGLSRFGNLTTKATSLTRLKMFRIPNLLRETLF